MGGGAGLRSLAQAGGDARRLLLRGPHRRTRGRVAGSVARPAFRARADEAVPGLRGDGEGRRPGLPLLRLPVRRGRVGPRRTTSPRSARGRSRDRRRRRRSEEHTSELQSQSNLVCRLLLEKKKKNEKDI